MAPVTGRETARHAEQARLMAEDDPEKVRVLFEAFFARIPHDWYRKNGIYKVALLQPGSHENQPPSNAHDRCLLAP